MKDKMVSVDENPVEVLRTCFGKQAKAHLCLPFMTKQSGASNLTSKLVRVSR